MPLSKMEPAVVEERDKSLKKRKKTDPDMGKGIQKITDHFKTPEKDGIVIAGSKQKSLLQFFTKNSSPSTVAKVETEKVFSDKENAFSSSNIVFPKWTSGESEGSSMPVQKKTEQTQSEVPNKPPVSFDNKVDAENEDTSDSVILLSDTSCNTPEVDLSKNKVNKKNTDKMKGKKLKTSMVNRTADEKSDKNVEMSSKGELDADKQIPTELKEENTHIDQDDNMEIDVKKDLQDSDKAQTNTDPSNNSTDKVDNNNKKLKKNALKGSEMMNLLKEIKNSEKKEKKKKHKHKDKYHEEDKHDSENTGEERKTKQVDDVEQEGIDLVEPDSLTKDHGTKKSLRARRPKSAVETVEMPSVDKENNEDKDVKMESGQTMDQDIVAASNDITESIEKSEATMKENIKNEQEKTDVKEMSYSEYLKSLENDEENSISNESDGENFTKLINDDADESNMEVDIGESADLNNISETAGIAKFFNFKTSTPKLETKKKNSDNKPKTKGNYNCLKKSGASKEMKTKKLNQESNTKKTPAKSKPDCDIIICDENKGSIKSSFLKSDQKTLFPEKTKQATLSFGSSGLVMSKQVEESQEKLLKEKEEDEKPQPKKRGRKKKTDVTPIEPVPDNLDSSASVFTTPKRGRKRRTEEKQEDSVVEEDADSNCETFERGLPKRRSTRKKYQITAFQMDNSQKTPIKLKLKRCKKSSSSGDDELAYLQEMQKQIKLKLSRAQALLEKARKNKKKIKGKKSAAAAVEIKIKDKKEKKEKTKQDKALNDSSRRSSRLKDKCLPSMEEVSLDNIVISSDEDDSDVDKPKVRGRPKGSLNKATLLKMDMADKEEKKTPKKNVKKMDTPKKAGTQKTTGTPKKSPKKGAKLAPLFMIGKNKALPQSPIKPQLDPEQARQRQQFLMSGVPEELKKQTATRMASVIEADYPPIPTDNHVQQVPVDSSTCKSWALDHVDLKLRPFTVPDQLLPVSKFDQCIVQRNSAEQLDLERLKTFSKHQQLEEALVTDCLGEISSFNPNYPVQKIYKALKQNLSLIVNTGINTGMKTDMTGIIPPAVTEVINVDVEEKPAPKKRGRPSLKLKKKELEAKATAEPEPSKPEETGKMSNTTGQCVLWTDRYCPTKSSEVLGNGSVLKKLKNWLTEWKQVLDREARKARKLLMKKNKGKIVSKTTSSPDDMWDDDSDFDLDSDDSEDDMSLCNTMLLLGPNGCGKTCSVYALAQELGFKVHEVNASASRSGRHILSQLQEATQSHQVASIQGPNTPNKKAAAAPEKPPSTKMTTAFNSFFKKTAKPQSVASGKEKKRKRNASNEGGSPEKKRQRKSLEKKQLLSVDENSQSLIQGLNLTSTTMILFDEVDVFFEEDKGFLSAIQTFMSTTKIPIILTTSDPGFTTQFDGRYEQIAFKSPPVRSIVSRLQTISLLENLRLDVTKLSELVQFYRGDVRKCLLSLQYILDTGGSDSLAYRVFQKLDTSAKPQLPVIMEDSQECSQDSQNFTPSQTSLNDLKDKGDFDEDEDDFVIHKPTVNARRKRILEDDSSNSVDAFSDVFLQKQASLVSGSSDSEAEAKKCLPVHLIGVELLEMQCTSGKQSPHDMLLNLFKGVCKDTGRIVELCSSLRRATGSSTVLHTNLPLLMPLTVKVVESLTAWSNNRANSDKTEPPKRSRIWTNDLYDSEASNDATDVEKIEEKTEENKVEDVKTESRDENLCLSRVLSSFSSFYDTMSSLDVLETSKSCQFTDTLQSYSGRELRGRLDRGMETSLPQVQTGCSIDMGDVLECSAEIEVRSACRMYTEVDEIQTQVERLCDNNPAFSEQLVLPVTKANSTFSLTDTAGKRSVEAQRAGENVLDNLPLVVHKQQRHLHLDYMPTLRHMCRLEQCRQITNTKRRFQHYFDSVNLCMRDRTICTLSTTFS